MPLGSRIIKTAIAASLAVWIAEMLSLPFSTSAGILAILGVQPTRKKTVQNVLARFFASIFGLLIGSLFFFLMTFSPWVIGFTILVFFPFLVRFHMQAGIITGVVVILHLYSVQTMTWELLGTELAVIVIGFGTALIVNLSYMPNLKKQAQDTIQTIDRQLSRVFHHFQNHLLDETYIWDGAEFIELEQTLAEGKDLALRTMENHLLRNEDDFYRYIRMREKQFDWVQHMMSIIARIDQTVPQSYLLAELFADLSEQVRSPYYSGKVLHRLKDLYDKIDKMELPQSRKEFETRSSLFQLLRELEYYLTIAEKEKDRKA